MNKAILYEKLSNKKDVVLHVQDIVRKTSLVSINVRRINQHKRSMKG